MGSQEPMEPMLTEPLTEWNKITPQTHIRTNGLKMSAILGVISDIHMVHTNLEDPVDVRNDPQQGTHPQAIRSSNFLM